MDFKIFGCFEKLKLRSLRKVVRLFTKYAFLGLCVAGFEKSDFDGKSQCILVEMAHPDCDLGSVFPSALDTKSDRC